MFQSYEMNTSDATMISTKQNELLCFLAHLYFDIYFHVCYQLVDVGVVVYTIPSITWSTVMIFI